MNHKEKLAELILTVIREGGSDLHLGAGRVPAIRVTGELIFLVKNSVFTQEDMIGILSEVLDKVKVDRFMENQEADFSYDFRGEARLRGNAFFQKGLINIAFRLLPKVKTLAELHLPPILADLTRKRQGFFLVVGPVGQGKSTTISSMINLINNEQTRHIITIEDPIEYLFVPNKSIINQREVGIDTKDFHTGLKSVFREDVNVIMDAIASGIPSDKEVHRYPNRKEALMFALREAKPGDIVMVTGKGHERSLCRGKKEYPWSDQEEIKKIVKHLHISKMQNK